jgi:hypothetical protein
MHEFFIPQLPRLMSEQDFNDPEFLKLRKLLKRAQGEHCAGNAGRTGKLMFDKMTKPGWSLAPYSSDCSPGHIAVLILCAHASILLPAPWEDPPVPVSILREREKEEERREKEEEERKKREEAGECSGEQCMEVNSNGEIAAGESRSSNSSGDSEGAALDPESDTEAKRKDVYNDPNRLDITPFMHYYQLANYQIPLAVQCLDRSMWGYDAEEFFDNYRSVMRQIVQMVGDQITGDTSSIDVSPRAVLHFSWRVKEHPHSEAILFRDRPHNTLPLREDYWRYSKRQPKICDGLPNADGGGMVSY